jgi:hypothetical protein
MEQDQQRGLKRNYVQLVSRTWQDPAFKQRLMADARGVLKEQGLSLPAGKTVQVVEDTPETMHLLLPAKPARPLSDEQLARFAEQVPGPEGKMGQLLMKAWGDESFKRRLTADPRSVLQERGVPLPDRRAVRVVEDTGDTLHLILPSKPADGELSHGELEQVTGGIIGFVVLGAAMLVAGIAMDSDFDWHSWG